MTCLPSCYGVNTFEGGTVCKAFVQVTLVPLHRKSSACAHMFVKAHHDLPSPSSPESFGITSHLSLYVRLH